MWLESLAGVLVSHKCLGERERPLVFSKNRVTFKRLVLGFGFLFCLIVQVLDPVSLCFLTTMQFAPWGVDSLCTEKWWKNCLRTHCSVFACVCVPVSSMYNLPFFIIIIWISKIPPLLPLEQHFWVRGRNSFLSFLPLYCFNCIPVRYADNVRAFAACVFVRFCSELIFQEKLPLK